MIVLDPGHQFLLDILDGYGSQRLTFVKRDQPPEKYPGNDGHYPGTNCQEVLRVLLSRLRYLQGQDAACENGRVIDHLERALYELEARAHRKHGGLLTRTVAEVVAASPCPRCGHVFCTWCAVPAPAIPV